MAARTVARARRRQLPAGGVRFDDALAQLGAHSVEELALVHVIQDHVNRVLTAFGRSRTVTATVLGVHRRSLQRMLARGINAVPGVGGSRPQPEAGLKRRLKELTVMKGHSLEERIQAVVKQTAEVIAEMVRADLSEEVQRALANRSSGTRPDAARPGAKDRRALTARRVPAHCIAPDCDRPHKGPRFSFVCDEHIGVPKADKRKYLDAWKAQNTAVAKGGARKQQIAHRRRGVGDDALRIVLKAIDDNPGLRSEQIYERVSLPADVAKKALAKLREDHRVKTKGERRAMTYAPA